MSYIRPMMQGGYVPGRPLVRTDNVFFFFATGTRSPVVRAGI
jgi:hypothetical protein